MRVWPLGDLIEISDYRDEQNIQSSSVTLAERNWDNPDAPWNRSLSFQVRHRIRLVLTFLFAFLKRRKKS